MLILTHLKQVSMDVVKIPTESIQLKDKVVPKHVVIFKDKVVYVGTKPQ